MKRSTIIWYVVFFSAVLHQQANISSMPCFLGLLMLVNPNIILAEIPQVSWCVDFSRRAREEPANSGAHDDSDG